MMLQRIRYNSTRIVADALIRAGIAEATGAPDADARQSEAATVRELVRTLVASYPARTRILDDAERACRQHMLTAGYCFNGDLACWERI